MKEMLSYGRQNLKVPIYLQFYYLWSAPITKFYVSQVGINYCVWYNHRVQCQSDQGKQLPLQCIMNILLINQIASPTKVNSSLSLRILTFNKLNLYMYITQVLNPVIPQFCIESCECKILNVKLLLWFHIQSCSLLLSEI